MSIFALGINHKTAPIAVRERLYFDAEKLSVYLQDLLGQGFTQEAVLLSTCNRTEVYCETDDETKLLDWFCSQSLMSKTALEHSIYIYKDEMAVGHIMRVACGLDSMVLGEPQILGQMKQAFSESCTVSAVSTRFHRLFQEVFKVAKEIRTTTDIGACPVSIASAAVHFVKQEITHLKEAQVVLIGAGETISLLMRYLHPLLSRPVIFLNRSLDSIQPLVTHYGGQAATLESLEQYLLNADLIFSATGSPQPLVTAEFVKSIQQRANRTKLFIDLAVPRDIESGVAYVEGVKLFCIDDLKNIIALHRQDREHAARKADELIRQKVQLFLQTINSLDDIAYTIRAYRRQIEAICQHELLKAKQQIKLGADPEHVLESFAYTFTNKLLHSPSVQLRAAGAKGRFDLLNFAKELFALPDPKLNSYETID